MDTVPTEPSDWNFGPLKDIDALLRCSICYEYLQTAVMAPQCSHNFCSLCIRRHLLITRQCPLCSKAVADSELRCNRLLDELVASFTASSGNQKNLSIQFMTLTKTIIPPPRQQFVKLLSHATEIARERDKITTSNVSSNVPSVSCIPDYPSVSQIPDHPSVSRIPDHPSMSQIPDHPSVSRIPDPPSVIPEFEDSEESAINLFPDDLPSVMDTVCTWKSSVGGPDCALPLADKDGSSPETPPLEFKVTSRYSAGWNRGGFRHGLPRPEIGGVIKACTARGDGQTDMQDQPSNIGEPKSEKSISSPIFTDSILNKHSRTKLQVAFDKVSGNPHVIAPLLVTPIGQSFNSPSSSPRPAVSSHNEGGVVNMTESYLSAQSSVPSSLNVRVKCPVCAVEMSQQMINSHLDHCLNLTSSTANKPSKSISTTFTSTSSSTARSLPRLPKLVVSVMKDKVLKRKLKEYNLSTQGTRQAMVTRLQEFTLLYNAQCDSLNPKTAKEIAVEVDRAEREKLNSLKTAMIASQSSSQLASQRKRANNLVEPEEQRKTYERENEDHFGKLIAEIQGRKDKDTSILQKTSHDWSPSSDRQTLPLDDDCFSRSLAPNSSLSNRSLNEQCQSPISQFSVFGTDNSESVHVHTSVTSRLPCQTFTLDATPIFVTLTPPKVTTTPIMVASIMTATPIAGRSSPSGTTATPTIQRSGGRTTVTPTAIVATPSHIADTPTFKLHMPSTTTITPTMRRSSRRTVTSTLTTLTTRSTLKPTSVAMRSLTTPSASKAVRSTSSTPDSDVFGSLSPLEDDDVFGGGCCPLPEGEQLITGAGDPQQMSTNHGVLTVLAPESPKQDFIDGCRAAKTTDTSVKTVPESPTAAISSSSLRANRKRNNNNNEQRTTRNTMKEKRDISTLTEEDYDFQISMPFGRKKQRRF